MPEKAVGKGLAAVDRYYQDYGFRARELKGEGKRIKVMHIMELLA